MDTSSPQVDAVSPDGQFRWDGQQWVPLPTSYRVPTSWTGPMRLAVVAYFAVGIVYGLVVTILSVVPLVNGQVPAGVNVNEEQARTALTFAAVFAVAFTVAISIFSAVLAVGALLGWRWAFWVTLVWLGLSSLNVVISLLSLFAGAAAVARSPGGVWVPAISFVIALAALGLFIWMLVAAIRYGPWAMRRPGAA